MKMPRPIFPVPLRPDLFGLPPIPSLLEDEEETRKRVSAVERGVKEAFEAAVRHVGQEEARRLFTRVARRRKRGRGKAHVPDRDAILLEEYDAAVQRGETTAALARRLNGERKWELGNTAGAIAAQIRKLVKERKRRQRAAAVRARRLRMAARHMPVSLLSSALSDAEGEK